MRQLHLPDGRAVPVLGQGTWYMGENPASRAAESDALRLGLDLGMTLIDTAEMYADGAAEEVVGHALTGQRARAFVVSKVYPHNATRAGVQAACARSLKRLGTDHLDLYLLHWRGTVPLAETVAGFEALQKAGHIRGWGVSNLDPADMDEVFALSDACAVDQVLYNPEHRGIEFDLLGQCQARGVPIMAYSPLGQAGRLLRNAALVEVAARHGATSAQIALAWALRHPGVIAIPKAATAAHVRANAAAVAIKLSSADLAALDASFPPPRRAQPLAML